jgi:GGDEF domain-containing protein
MFFKEGKLESPEGKQMLAFLVLGLAIAIGILSIGAFSFQAKSVPEGLSVFGFGLLVSGVSFLVGMLLGFLFAIPRSLQHASSGENGKAQGGSNSETQPRYGANTNLEEISDWLTKILVGVGLTQITVLPQKLNTTAAFLAGGLGGYNSSQGFVLLILLYFLVSGFLLSYLWTRLYLPGQLTRAEFDAIAPVREGLDKIEQLVRALKVGLQKEEYLEEVKRIREKEDGKGNGVSFIYADVDDLKKQLADQSNGTLLRAEVLDILAGSLEEASTGKVEKHNIFFLSVGDPDRIMLIRTSNATSGEEIAERALTRFMEKTKGRKEFGLNGDQSLTASFGVIWASDATGDNEKLHKDALKLLEEAKDAGKNCVKNGVFTP